METGYIKLWRKFLKWEWYKDPNTKSVFLHLLLTCNHEDYKFMGHDVPRGSVVIGRKALSKELGMSEKSVRTSINHLKTASQVAIKTTNKFSIVSILNYSIYQDTNTTKRASKVANEGPTKGQQGATIKEYKNVRMKEERHSTDEEFLASLKAICLDRGCDFDLEMGKMDKWLSDHPDRRKTRRFMKGWIERADRVVTVPGLQVTRRATKLQGIPSNPNRIGLAEICQTNSQSSLEGQ